MSTDQHREESKSTDVDHLTRLARWLTVCFRALNRFFSVELAALDLSPVEFILLWTCGQNRNSSMSQSQLASMTGVSPAQLSQTAERLRRQGWIVLVRSKTDRRRQSLELTPQGAAKLQAARQRLKNPAAAACASCHKVVNAEVVALLRQLASSIQTFSDATTAEPSKNLSENLLKRGGQAHFAPKTPQNEPVPGGFRIGSESDSQRKRAA